ncbi:MAG: nitronate monooxygenase [Mariprofundales bacterium]|nr:nitronate monooxygenase [Mariprofundales bacterium]
MTFPIAPMQISGREVLPLVEGGKGVAASSGLSSGAWANAGGVGTFSAVNADHLDDNGEYIPLIYHGKSRIERHEELIAYSIAGGISQAKIAHDVAAGNGRIHMNVLWEMAASERVLRGVFEGAPDLIHGVTCGAGMPFKLAPLAAEYNAYYYPIISSARAFRALWLRSYRKVPEWLGGVVYEDPWLAGGHNGLSNSENPQQPEAPYSRVALLRQTMNEFGLQQVPIVMAGGVWALRDWSDWIDNTELGPIAFQLGTRPLLTQESPISDQWKRKLLTLKPGDISLNHFSPTGFYSSAVRNTFLHELEERAQRELAFVDHPAGDHVEPFVFGVRDRTVYVTQHDAQQAQAWQQAGFTKALTTPDSTLIFVSPERAQLIRKDQLDCMGCLSQCKFSNWSCNALNTTGRKADPRSFCIQLTLQNIVHGANPDDNLMFSGHAGYRFAKDPLYAEGNIPTVAELIEVIRRGD